MLYESSYFLANLTQQPQNWRCHYIKKDKEKKCFGLHITFCKDASQKKLDAYPQNSSITAKSYNEINLCVQQLYLIIYKNFLISWVQHGKCYVNKQTVGIT